MDGSFRTTLRNRPIPTEWKFQIPNSKIQISSKLSIPKFIRKPSYDLIVYHLAIDQLNTIWRLVFACLRLPAGRQEIW